MPHAVEIVRRVRGGLSDREVRRAVDLTLRALKRRPPQAVSVTFVGDAAMRALNKRTRKIDKTTDVLSFPGEGSFPAQGAPTFFGDVVISLPYARRDAKQLDITMEHELFDLLVHGLLHCAGHDHVKPAEARRMFRLQESLVSRLCSR